jgi:hypothetical protein
LKALRIQRTATSWVRAVPAEPSRADILLALGFEPRGEPTLLYAGESSFEAHVPPRRTT